MKTTWIIGSVAIVMGSFLTACNKDPEGASNCRINKVTQNNAVLAQAYYNNANKLERFVTYDQSTQIISEDFRLFRNSEGKLDSARAFNASGNLIGKYKIIYNVSGQAGRIDLFTDGNNDGEFNLLHYYEIIYNGSNDPVEITKFEANGAEDATYTFEWNNGNVTKFNNDGPRLELNFDDKLSLYTGIGKDVLFLNPQLLPLVMSKNNPLNITQYSPLNIFEFSIDFTYTYNDKNLPTQSVAVNGNNSTVTSYEYNCD